MPNQCECEQIVCRCGKKQDQAIRRDRPAAEVRVAHPTRDEWYQREPEQQMEVRPQDSAIDPMRSLEEMMVVVPVDPDVHKAEQVTEKFRDQVDERTGVAS